MCEEQLQHRQADHLSRVRAGIIAAVWDISAEHSFANSVDSCELLEIELSTAAVNA